MAPPSFTLRHLWRPSPPSPSPLLIENVGNNLRYISKRYFSTQLLWFYGYFANGYSANSTEVCKEIHDNSDVIAILKTEHIYLFEKKQHSETKKTIQNSVILLKYKVYFSLQIASEFSMIVVPDFIDETGGMTRPSVSTSSSSIIWMLWLQCCVFFVRQIWHSDQFSSSPTH